jgi:two-component system sensor histidine kinase VicK
MGEHGDNTRVLYNPEEILESAIHLFSNVKERVYVCADYKAPSSHYNIKPIWNKLLELKGRGIQIRFITEVTGKNLFYCKELLKVIGELRHLDGIKGNFGIADSVEYRASPAAEENHPPPQYVISNVKTIVQQQEYFFEMLWNKAIPAIQRIKEIEQGRKRQFTETIQDPKQIQKTTLEVIESANHEILMLFSTFNEFYRLASKGILKTFHKLALDRDVRVKILSPKKYDADNDDSCKDLGDISELEKSIGHYHNKICFRYLEQTLQTKVTIIVIDKKISLVVELNDGDAGGNSSDGISAPESTGSAIFSNSESTVTSLSTIFDMLWKQVDIYEELKDMHNELRVRDVALNDFINIAAHELRNPIQPILSLSETLRYNNPDPENIEYLKVIVRNARRLKKLSEDILDVTKIEKGIFKLNESYFNLRDIVSNAIEDLNNQISQNGNPKVLLKTENDPKDFFILFDKGRILQVITNLVDNAIKYNSKNEPITIIIKKKDNCILTQVKDTGPGISVDMIPKLFSKFASTSTKGTGLGLYISKNIVEAHGGHIWAKNNEHGKGTTFSFSLPINK